MRKILIALSICFILLATGGTALAQGGGAGWFDFVTDVRLLGQVWVLNDLLIGDDLNIADLIASTYTTVTVTSGSTITPVGMYQRLTSAANTGTSAIANPTAGRLLILVNVANTTITLTDTGTLKLNGNVALSQYDAVQLLGDGTNWIQIAPVGNN